MRSDQPGRLPFGLRAGIAVALIAGFYVLVFAVMVGLGFGFGLLLGSGGWATFGAFLLFAMLIAAAVGLGRGLRPWSMSFGGALLDEADQPQLWALVRDLAERVGTRAPDEIWLVLDVNAGVMEHTKLLGLRGGQRYLVLGVPVLMALTVEQLCAVIAHELGHYSHAHARMCEINYRGRTAMLAAYVKLKRINPIRWLFAGYARLYFLVEAGLPAGSPAGPRRRRHWSRSAPSRPPGTCTPVAT